VAARCYGCFQQEHGLALGLESGFFVCM